jgi:hypothetical protein
MGFRRGLARFGARQSFFAGEGVKKYGINEDFLVYPLLETEPLNFLFSAAI